MKNLISLILLALTVALGIFMIKPAYDQIGVLRVQKSSYDAALSSAKQLQTLRDSLTQSYNNISPNDQTKLALILPTSFDPVKLTADLSAAAALQGMSVSQVQVVQDSGATSNRSNVTATAATNPYQTYSVSFVTSGQFPAFVAFLHTMESDAELLDLRKIAIVPSRQSNGSSQLDFTVTVDTYAMPLTSASSLPTSNTN